MEDILNPNWTSRGKTTIYEKNEFETNSRLDIIVEQNSK